MGRPKETYADTEYHTAKAEPGLWHFFLYPDNERAGKHVEKVTRWLKREGAEVRGMNLDGARVLAVRIKDVHPERDPHHQH